VVWSARLPGAAAQTLYVQGRERRVVAARRGGQLYNDRRAVTNVDLTKLSWRDRGKGPELPFHHNRHGRRRAAQVEAEADADELGRRALW
jgi:hypothetical protein